MQHFSERELHPDFPWERLSEERRTVAGCALYCLRALRNDYRNMLGKTGPFCLGTERQDLHYPQLEEVFSIGLPMSRKLPKVENGLPVQRNIFTVAIEWALYISTRVRRGQKLERNLSWPELLELRRKVLHEMDVLSKREKSI